MVVEGEQASGRSRVGLPENRSPIPLHSNWTELLDGLLELGTLPERIDNPNSAVILIVVKILAVDFQAARGFRRLDN